MQEKVTIHYKDPSKSPFERLSGRTVKAISLIAFVLTMRFLFIHSDRVEPIYAGVTLLALVLQYPIFRYLQKMEKKRKIVLKGDHLDFQSHGHKETILLDGETKVSASSFLGFLPFIGISRGKSHITIPVIMDGVNEVPEHLLDTPDDPKRLRRFITYYRAVGKELDKISKQALWYFIPLAFFGAAAAHFVWEATIEGTLFWVLISMVVPLLIVAGQLMVTKLLLNAGRIPKRLHIPQAIVAYIIIGFWLFYGILFKNYLNGI